MDHETRGAQEWQLAGYSRVPTPVRPPPSAGRFRPASRPTHGQTKAFNQANIQNYPVTGMKNALPTRGTYQGQRGRGNPTPAPGLPEAGNFNAPNRLLRDSQAKAKWRSGLRPTETFRLPSHYGKYKHHILQAGRELLGETLGKGAFEVFDHISFRSGAYVKQPSYNDREVSLWGEQKQIATAKELVLRLVRLCDALVPPPIRKMQDWAKISAYKLTKEERIDYKHKVETRTLELRKVPHSSLKVSEKLLFLWPNGELPMREVLGPELELLDPIRIEFGCHIYIFDQIPEYICVSGQTHEILREIARRLRTKWHELMATSNIRSKVYLTYPPEPASIKGGIFIKTIQGSARPFFPRGASNESQDGPQQERFALMQSKNDSHLLSAAERTLRGLPFFRGHLRMRVNVGSFIFDEYRVPRDTQTGYAFEEFREMILHEKTRGRLVPGLDIDQNELIKRCSLASDLLKPVSASDTSLDTTEPKYTVNFEFEGSDNAILRLEAEFGRHGGAQEYEAAQRRWVKSQSHEKRPLLQVVVIDPDRADWQLEVKAVQFHEPSNISASIQKFNRQLAFRKGVAGETLSSKPRRRVIVPDGVPVCRIIEKAAVHYRLKGTDYILEIARYDEYQYISVANSEKLMYGTPKKMSEVPLSTWGASIFCSSWDNLLGQHANVKVGRVANWSPTLDTFFPAKDVQDPLDPQAGFWHFVSIAKEAATLLGKPQAKNAQDISNKTSSLDSKNASQMTGSIQMSRESPSNDAPNVLAAELGTLF